MDSEAVALLRVIADHLGAIRTKVEGGPAPFDRHAELLAAIREDLGAGCPFTTAGLLDLADRESFGAVGSALAKLIDLDAPGRAVALGKLLAGCDELERTHRAGVLLYRLSGDE